MKSIDGHTRISVLIKGHPGALETLISLSPRFEKLRNPLLRRLMAPRTTIEMACRIGAISKEDFFSKFEKLGFLVQDQVEESSVSEPVKPPEFMRTLKESQVISLNVIPVINEGKDPLKLILQKIELLKSGQVLKLTNSFEPLPLINLLRKKGFESFTEMTGDGNYSTWFYKTAEAEFENVEMSQDDSDWSSLVKSRKDNLREIDVRSLEMPLPMLTILEALDGLDEKQSLYVIHKRVPLFLLPELEQRYFKYKLHEKSENEVHMLIYKD
jgi:uncharacterized protein (DUF2249 family)